MTPEDELELKVLTDAEAHPRVSTTYKAVHGTEQTHEVTTAIRLASDEPAKIEIDQVPQRIGFVVRVLRYHGSRPRPSTGVADQRRC